MDAENMASFIHCCINDNCKATDGRVTSTISTWDTDNDGRLTLSDFLTFYKNACENKKAIVWKNLHAHNYRNDLKLLSEIGEDIQVKNYLFSWNLINNLLFRISILFQDISF